MKKLPRINVELWAVHHLTKDVRHTTDQVLMAAEYGYKSMLIDMEGDDANTLDQLAHIARELPSLGDDLGANLLGLHPEQALLVAEQENIHTLWFDSMKINEIPLFAARWHENPRTPVRRVFAPLLFKGQPFESTNLWKKRLLTYQACGIIPTTSGIGTGHEIDKTKLFDIRQQCNEGARHLRPLALASGVTPTNARDLQGHATHILVNTGISSNFHHLDYELMRRLRGSFASNEIMQTGE